MPTRNVEDPHKYLVKSFLQPTPILGCRTRWMGNVEKNADIKSSINIIVIYKAQFIVF